MFLMRMVVYNRNQRQCAAHHGRHESLCHRVSCEPWCHHGRHESLCQRVSCEPWCHHVRHNLGVIIMSVIAVVSDATTSLLQAIGLALLSQNRVQLRRKPHPRSQQPTSTLPQIHHQSTPEDVRIDMHPMQPYQQQ